MSRAFKDLSIEEVEAYLDEARLPKFRASQILSWVYSKGISSYEDMTNIPKIMREQLAVDLPLYAPAIESIQQASDGTKKYLLRFHDGALAETVGLPSEDGRLTVCASSQSGCAMGCTFCATGRAGLTRSLYPGEIVDQILLVQKDFDQRVTNVVVMGQGEPFSNFENTINGLRILNHEKLVNIGARHITVSTCGLIEGINHFSDIPEQFTLAISLHSARQNIRDAIMPAMKNQRLGALREALTRYSESTGRRYSFEYALMKDINDTEDDLNELIKYCKNLLCHVNLIPLNHVPGSSIEPVSSSVISYWNQRLQESGVASSIRKSRGSDIAAACGQLASQYK